MNILLFAVLMVVIVTAQSDCTETQEYIMIIKKTLSFATEESFKVMDGTTTLYTSPSLVDSKERELLVCVIPSTNNQYTLTIFDKYGDSWSDGAWIKIVGVNGNVVLQAMMSEKSTESFKFSLYTPIHKNSSWKYITTASGAWKDHQYNDAQWTTIILGNNVTESTGTQYFRHTFNALLTLPAIEIQFLFRFGIVAYINGREVYRDNMPNGVPSDMTQASGSYSVLDYRGVIRPAELSVTDAVLAVEIHFMQTATAVIDFNAFLAMYAGTSSTTDCFVVPITPTVTTENTWLNPTKAFDWTRSSYSYITTSLLPGSLKMEYDIKRIPMVNSMRIWPYTNYANQPKSFVLSGSYTSGVDSNYMPMITMDDVTYTASVYKDFKTFIIPREFPYLKLTVLTSGMSITHIGELQMMICNMMPPSVIEYPEPSYSYYANYDSVDLKLTMEGYSGCQIQPALPTGLSINYACDITGFTSVESTNVYTITATGGIVSATGTVSLTFIACQGSMVELFRSYKSNAVNEGFIITNAATDEIIFQATIGGSQTSSHDWSRFMCLAVESMKISLQGSSPNWDNLSYLTISYLLPAGEKELVLRVRMDSYLGNDVVYTIRQNNIKSLDTWHYKMGSVSTNWYNSETTGWTESNRGLFPASSNRIQLYKKTFNLVSLTDVSNPIISIRYKYGCIVYLNGHEVFRNGVTGDLSDASVGDNIYTDLLYRVFTVPGRSIPEEGQTSIPYILQGSNTIAIAIVAVAVTQTESVFDATLRFMTSTPEGHIYDFTSTTSGITGIGSNAFDNYFGNSISGTVCNSNSLIVVLANDRREWVSSVMAQITYNSVTQTVKRFMISARNAGEENWTLLKNVDGLTWSLPSQRKVIYFRNNRSFNQFKFENFASGVTLCSWKIQTLNLLADNVLTDSTLSYPSSTEVFANIEMSELIPSIPSFYDFSILPALPEGLMFDPMSGWISGTAVVVTPAATTYTVTAHKIIGDTVTTTFSLSVGICSIGRSLMTFRIRGDSYAHENSWKLHQGRGLAGSVLRSVTKYPIASGYYYVDFCLNDNIYTFEGIEIYGDGWSSGTGYTLTVDMGGMELDIMQMKGQTVKPISVSTVFSTFFPFQIDFTDWKVHRGYDIVATDWNTPSFNDALWKTHKAANIGTNEVITTYIRKSFTMTTINEYRVMNVRVKYAGGVAAYFNGHLVARFNLVTDFIGTTQSIVLHDGTLFSKFHFLLALNGLVEGTNVISFEIHRPIDESSSVPVVFDATGVFGVEDCSTVVDSYSTITSSNLSSGTIASIMDLDPFTQGTIQSKIGAFVEWTVENLEGSKWNSFNILGGLTVSGWDFSIYGTMNLDSGDEEERISILDCTGCSVIDRTKTHIPVPVAMVGFQKYRWEVDDTGTSNPSIGAMFSAYCTVSGATVCAGDGKYPSVGNGEISPSSCPDGYTGYSYRICSQNTLGDVQTDKCKMKPPANLRYSSSVLRFVLDTQVTTGKPSYSNIISRFYTDVPLPLGLLLDEITGEINGIPTEIPNQRTYLVVGENVNGAVSVSFDIFIRKGSCKAEGVFSSSEAGVVAVYDCALQGNYIGSMKRACKLGKEDGEWMKASGFCVSILTIVLLVVVVIVIIMVIVLMIIRSTSRRKIVGGVKGKSSKKSSKTSNISKKSTTDTKSNKAVKV